ncbi:MAG: UDP-N-acetylmuramoyl-tripeptide--D-alanyl-D-alanine ligase [Candidatus Beckwithbacteria bacterium]|nr:UDP-N-acetylmuramoyl-tripeptide--D-alanyl-D-alanine ligase [Candidatus Beckwithbacteria bacterium]
MIFLLQIIYFILLLVAILRCLYFWQLKEYRLDRFHQFLATSQARQYWLPVRWFLRPKLTLKILVLIYLSLYFSQILLQLKPFWLWLIIAYLIMPLTATIAVLLLKPITDLLSDLVVFAAKIKLKFSPRSLIVIGITGSFGKTSTKEILAHVLSAKFSVCKTSGTNNTLIGVALAVLTKLHSSHDFFVVEMGAYKPGEIKAICQLVKPKLAILTGIGTQHLGLFGSQPKLISAKSELLQSLVTGSHAFINGENQIARSLVPQFSHLKIKLYFRPKKPYSTNLLGDYQQVNLTAAVQVASKFKIPSKVIISRLTNIPAFKTMMVKKTGLKHSIVIDNTYNANFDGFLAAINFIKTQNFSQNILITSGIIELGSRTAALHQQLAQAAGPVFTKIYLTKADIAKFFPGSIYEPDPKKILKDLIPILNSKTLVLLESRLPKKFIASLCPNQS